MVNVSMHTQLTIFTHICIEFNFTECVVIKSSDDSCLDEQIIEFH
jgi:hypothetical protein